MVVLNAEHLMLDNWPRQHNDASIVWWRDSLDEAAQLDAPLSLYEPIRHYDEHALTDY